MTEPLQILITADDLSEYGDHFVRELVAGKTPSAMLGSGSQKYADKLAEAVPKVIAAKLSQMLPTGFELSELTMTFKVKSSFALIGLDGEVQVKMRPKDPTP